MGAILAPLVPLPEGRLRKGKELNVADVDQLAAHGLTEIAVARLDAAGAHENAAALDVASALVAGKGLILQPVGTGRVNSHAVDAGIAGLNARQINAGAKSKGAG